MTNKDLSYLNRHTDQDWGGPWSWITIKIKHYWILNSDPSHVQPSQDLVSTSYVWTEMYPRISSFDSVNCKINFVQLNFKYWETKRVNSKHQAQYYLSANRRCSGASCLLFEENLPVTVTDCPHDLVLTPPKHDWLGPTCVHCTHPPLLYTYCTPLYTSSPGLQRINSWRKSEPGFEDGLFWVKSVKC